MSSRMMRLQRHRSLLIRRWLKKGGELTDKYYMDEEVGRGSFAVVWKGRLKSDPKQTVAIKVISKNKAGNELHLIENEINLHAECDHPNVGKIYEVFDSPTSVSVVMEYIIGGELFERLINSGKYTEKTASEAFRQILLGVAHIHEVGIVHRDLKPENLMLEAVDSNHIKVVDFGLAATCEKPLTEFIGTVAYLAPELAAWRVHDPTNEPYSFPVDAWALGCILFIMLTGKMPFSPAPTEANYAKIERGDYPKDLLAHLSPSAQDLIAQLLTVDPEKRITPAQALNHPWILSSSPEKPLENAARKLRRMSSAIEPDKRLSFMLGEGRTSAARLPQVLSTIPSTSSSTIIPPSSSSSTTTTASSSPSPSSSSTTKTSSTPSSSSSPSPSTSTSTSPSSSTSTSSSHSTDTENTPLSMFGDAPLAPSPSPFTTNESAPVVAPSPFPSSSIPSKSSPPSSTSVSTSIVEPTTSTSSASSISSSVSSTLALSDDSVSSSTASPSSLITSSDPAVQDNGSPTLNGSSSSSSSKQTTPQSTSSTFKTSFSAFTSKHFSTSSPKPSKTPSSTAVSSVVFEEDPKKAALTSSNEPPLQNRSGSGISRFLSPRLAAISSTFTGGSSSKSSSTTSSITEESSIATATTSPRVPSPSPLASPASSPVLSSPIPSSPTPFVATPIPSSSPASPPISSTTTTIIASNSPSVSNSSSEKQPTSSPSSSSSSSYSSYSSSSASSGGSSVKTTLAGRGSPTIKTASDICAVCQKRVYFTEKLVVKDIVLHRSCFKCATCRRVLQPTGYVLSENKAYCMVHASAFFR